MDLKKTLLTVFLFTLATISQAQETMGDTLRSNGRIYVVVAVILTIFIGIIIFLTRLDRKISKLEKTEKP